MKIDSMRGQVERTGEKRLSRSEVNQRIRVVGETADVDEGVDRRVVQKLRGVEVDEQVRYAVELVSAWGLSVDGLAVDACLESSVSGVRPR